MSDDGLGLAHPAGALRGPLGQDADLRAHDSHSGCAQFLQVRLRLRPGVHLVVHGRGQKQRRGASQKQRGQDVVGQTLSSPRNEVRGGRRHDDQVGGLAELDMRERPAPLPEGAREQGAR